MGEEILNIILEELDQYIKSVRAEENGGGNLLKSPKKVVVLENIARSKLAGGDDLELDNKVVVSLVNVAEEPMLKNKVSRYQIGGQFQEEFPPVHINLYLMFTANFQDYKKAVGHLLRVLEFFQGRKEFSLNTATRSKESNLNLEHPNSERALLVELHTLNFEQLNYLWGSLGGKQMPFVLYRARLLPIRMQRQTGHAGMITEIGLTTEGK